MDLSRNRTLSPIARCLVAVALVALAGSAPARNEQLMLPIDAALRAQNLGPAVTGDIGLKFGKVSAGAADAALATQNVAGAVHPFGPNDSNNAGRRERLPDDVACVVAFRTAVAKLQRHARAQQAVAVVGIVSNYNGKEMDSTDTYECHVGFSRAQVDLQGRFTRAAQ